MDVDVRAILSFLATANALMLILSGCSSYRAIERSEGRLNTAGKYIVLVNGSDELNLSGEVRNALREAGLTVVSNSVDATHIARLSYKTTNKQGPLVGKADIRIDRISIEFVESTTTNVIASHFYDRNNEKTEDWTWQIKDIIHKAVENTTR